MNSKIKKIFCFLFVIALVFVIGIKGTFAKAPNQITVKRAEELSDLVTNQKQGFTVFTIDGGQVVYCMDIDKKPLNSGDVATYQGDADGGMLYLLEHAYNGTITNDTGTKLTGKNEADKYITQAAVWWYKDEAKLSDSFKNAKSDTDIYHLVPDYIKPLVNSARSHASYKEGSVSLSNSSISANMHLTSDGKYYESDYMKITLTNAKTYTVSVSNGSVIAQDGKAKNTFASGEQFKVRIPASKVSSDSKVNVTVSAKGTVKKARIYATNDSSKQRVVGLFDTEETATKKFSLNIYAKKYTCKYVNGKYYDTKGNVTDKETFTKECQKVCVHEDGKYYDKNGNITTKETFQEQCSHTCDVKDGKYYGIDGTIVDKTTYEKECNHTCEPYGGKYYGKNGNEVDEATYNSECNKSCTFTDNIYYGKNGEVVDKGTFDSECGTPQEVVSPNTSSNVSPFAIVSGLISTLAGGFILAIKGKFIA